MPLKTCADFTSEARVDRAGGSMRGWKDVSRDAALYVSNILTWNFYCCGHFKKYQIPWNFHFAVVLL